MFYYIDTCDIANYADDNTPYTSDFNQKEATQKPFNLFEWFKNNRMKTDANKCYAPICNNCPNL